MQHILKFYLFALVFALTHAPLHASESDQNKQLSQNREFLSTADSIELTPSEQYTKLSTLLMQKADIGALDKRGATTLYNLVNAAGVYNRDNTASIKLLIDSKSPLKTQNSHLSIIERAVTYKMHPVLTLLVAAKADLNERSVAGQTCLHQIASLQQGEADETACKIFDILKQHGNLPIDNVVFQGKESYTALCFSRMGNKQKTGLVQRLLAHGANPYCPMSNSHRYCKQGDGMEAQAIHEAWKTDAHNAVVEKIPVTPLTNMVIDYCFGNPNFVSKKRKFE